MNFKTIATSFDTQITLDENHVYSSINEAGEIDVTSMSVTGILHPKGVPNMPHIKSAADYGTDVHSIISDFLNNKLPDVDKTRVAVKSAKVIVSKINDFLKNFKPKGIYRGVRTQLTPSYFPDVKMMALYTPTNAIIGGSADLLIEVKAKHGEIKQRVVVEFKTTKKTNKDHKLQVAAYMQFLGAEHGLVIYDDPEIQSVYIDRNEQKELIKCFTRKANDYFFGDVKVENEIADRLSEVCTQLKALNAQAKQLEIERNTIAQAILDKDEKASFALMFGVDVVIGNCKISLVESSIKKIRDMAFFKETYPQIYAKIVDETTTKFKKFLVIDSVENGGE
jgi:hypothetical protein